MNHWLEAVLLGLAIASGAFIACTYLLFPLLLVALARLRRAEPGAEGQPDGDWPELQVVVSCYNEAASIRDRLRNVLAQNYPADRLRVVVIDDGSTDGSDQVVEELASADSRVSLFRLDKNRGKNLALNRARQAGRLAAELLCLTDADSEFAGGALRAAVAQMADARIGLVGGEVRFRFGPGATARSESHYWRLENALRRAEGRMGVLVSAPGQLIVMRGELLEELPSDANTDFAVSLSVLAQGRRCVVAPGAVVRTPFPGGEEAAGRRRRRTILRALQTIRAYRGRPNRWARAIVFWHKTARFHLALPAAVLLAASAGGAAVAGSPPWFALTAVQAAFYLTAGAGWLASAAGARLPLASTAHQFVRQHVIAFRAVIEHARGGRVQRWTPSGR